MPEVQERVPPVLFPTLRSFKVSLPKPTKEDEYPEPVIIAQFEFGLTSELLQLLGRIARAGGAKMNLECQQGELELAHAI